MDTADRKSVVKVNPEIIPRIVGKDDSPERVNLSEITFACHTINDLEGLFAVNLRVAVNKVPPLCASIGTHLVFNPFFDQILIHKLILSLHVLDLPEMIFKADVP